MCEICMWCNRFSEYLYNLELEYDIRIWWFFSVVWVDRKWNIHIFQESRVFFLKHQKVQWKHRNCCFFIIVVVPSAYVVNACKIVVGFYFMNTISTGSCLNNGMKYWLYYNVVCVLWSVEKFKRRSYYIHFWNEEKGIYFQLPVSVKIDFI